MTTEAARTGRPVPQGPPRTFLLAEVIIILATWRRVIAAFAAGILMVTVIVTLLARPTYVARTSLMPQQESNEFGSLSSLVATFDLGGSPVVARAGVT